MISKKLGELDKNVCDQDNGKLKIREEQKMKTFIKFPDAPAIEPVTNVFLLFLWNQNNCDNPEKKNQSLNGFVSWWLIDSMGNIPLPEKESKSWMRQNEWSFSETPFKSSDITK